MHECYIDYDSFVPCGWWSIWIILYIGLLVQLDHLVQLCKVARFIIDHLRPPHLVWPLHSKSWFWTTTFAFWQKNQDSNPWTEIWTVEMWTGVTRTDVILCFGRAHADFDRPTIRSHIDTSSRNVTLTDFICFHMFSVWITPCKRQWHVKAREPEAYCDTLLCDFNLCYSSLCLSKTQCAN